MQSERRRNEIKVRMKGVKNMKELEGGWGYNYERS
jgi:hypothetical protein